MKDAQRTVLVGLALTFTLASLCPMAFSQDGKKSDGAKPQERIWSLKGERQDADGIILIGQGPDECVHFEPEGLRITLPEGFPGERRNTGVDIDMPVHGDFEITVNFEILHAPDPKDDFSGATRFNFMAYPQGAGFTTVGWRVFVKRGRQVFANAAGGGFKGSPTEMQKGRFRMVRAGADVDFLVAEGASDQFTTVHKLPFGSADLKAVSLVGSTSDPKVSLDVRFTDLHLRTGHADNAAPNNNNVRAISQGSGGLAGELLVGLLLTALVLFALWYVFRRRAKTE